MWAAATVSSTSWWWLGSKIVVKKNNNNEVGASNSTSTSTSKQRPSLSFRASFFDYPLATRLIVTNLPYSTSESRLQEEFSNFGDIAEVLLAKDRVTKRSRGYAFIQYTSQHDALLALETMDSKKFDGRMIYVELAKPGSASFRGYPTTSGPPKEQQPKLEVEVEVEVEEVADCWY